MEYKKWLDTNECDDIIENIDLDNNPDDAFDSCMDAIEKTFNAAKRIGLEANRSFDQGITGKNGLKLNVSIYE